MEINAKDLDYEKLNEMIRESKDKNITVYNTLGHRYIGSGSNELNLKLYGIPGNALGAYLNGSTIEVMGNSSDALGDTMNEGKIIVHGSAGDTCGYAMRGGKIYIRKNAGYRAGIHMKAYQDKFPVVIIGGYAGSFLGEYQAGGIIIVLGLDGEKYDSNRIIGDFPSAGMHGGKLFIRDDCKYNKFPEQVLVNDAKESDLDEIKGYLKEYANIFDLDLNEILNHEFKVITPNTNNPYKKLYIPN